jgi:hypothetical protein
MTKLDQLYLTGKLRTEPEVLDEDMSRCELVDVLRGLRFEEPFCVVWLDRPVRDYLIAMLTDHRR